MGIYDREYYRREGPSFLQAFSLQGQVCKWLIIINAIAFVVQLVTRSPDTGYSWFTELFELNAEKVLHGEIWRVLTYAFLHSPEDLLHIVFNMLFLWWFGHELEEMYGHAEFLTFYLVAAILGGWTFTLFHLLGMGNLCIGASGAVTAVMVVYAFHFPRRMILLFFILPVPIWLLVVFQVAQDTFGLLSHRTGGVAVTVHLAGAAFGALYYKLHWRLTDFWPRFRFRIRQRSRPRLRVYREEESETPQPVGVPSARGEKRDEQLEAELDRVLEKVARTGQASLTESEKQILLRASEIYKKRRS